MSWTSVLAARLRGVFAHERLERELDEEVRFHLEMQIEDNLKAGMDPSAARYAALETSAARLGAHRVALGHTADDQAETVLAHLLRGTGLTGLAGIYPVAGLTIRPLLEIGREELREYLGGLGHSWREDSSNQDTSRMRARIRHQLLPVLRRDFEPLSVTRLARLAGLAREEETFWRSLEEERHRTLASFGPTGNVSLKIDDLLWPLPLLAGPGGGCRLGGAGPPFGRMPGPVDRLRGRALAGQTYKKILEAYYPKAKLSKV